MEFIFLGLIVVCLRFYFWDEDDIRDTSRRIEGKKDE